MKQLIELKEVENFLQFGHLQAIKIRRRIDVQAVYDYWGRKDTKTLYGKADVAEYKKNVREGRTKHYGFKNSVRYEIQFVYKEAYDIPELVLYEHEVEDLLKGKTVKDWRRFFYYVFGNLTIVQLDSGGRGHYQTFHIGVPYEILQQAVARAKHRPWFGVKRYDPDWVHFRMTHRHKRFWRGRGAVKFHGDAAKQYERCRNWRAGDEYSKRTLKDIVIELRRTARNYSRNGNDPVTMNIRPDGDDSFFFWMTDKDGNRRGHVGGIVWHDDHYSTHT